MTEEKRIYLDYAASTPVDPDVLNKMMPYFSEIYGNSSATHYFGQRAEAAVEKSRETIASLLKCQPEEIIFTSGGSESDNLAVRGTALSRREKLGYKHVLVSPVEHQAVGSTARQLAEVYDFEVEEIPVDKTGKVDPDSVKKLIRKDTCLVSIIYGNNEVGTINPVAEIAEVCAGTGVPFHTDAVQAAAYLPIDLAEAPFSLMSVCAHKFYGPKGAGFLFKRNGIDIIPQQRGGGHELNLRAGTHNTPGIVGMAAAFELLYRRMDEFNQHYISLRDRLISGVLQNFPGSSLTGSTENRLPNHASFVFDRVSSNTMVMLLDAAGFACSSGSSCKSGNPAPSSVLLKMGYPADLALGALRVTVGRSTTEEQIDAFLEKLLEVVKYLRK